MARYRGDADYVHGTPVTTGVLLVNLGTPDAPTSAALRRYLGQFLWDPRVVEVPRPLWWLLLHAVILPLRPARSARAYRKIWTDEGSPLLVYSRRLAAAVQPELETRLPGPVQVALAMRYGQPSVQAALEELRASNVRRLLVLPLYPQYAAATTGAAFDAVADVLKTWRWVPELRLVGSYHDAPGYIDAIAASIAAAWETRGRPERLLFSFHGLPKRNLLAGDPYHCQCHKSARLVAQALRLPEDAWQVCFQSRFGRAEWLKPYTDHTLKQLARAGVKRVDVVCPGFSADCLETLEEIAMQNREFFMAAGGETFHYIPALNDAPAHVQFIGDLIGTHAEGWLGEVDQAALAAGRARALDLGAER